MTRSIHPTPVKIRAARLGLGLLLCVSIHVLAQVPTDSGGGPIRKKLIELGWGKLTPTRLLEHLPRVEQTPFDGLALNIIGTDEQGQAVSAFQICIPKPWKPEWFQGEINTLRKLKSNKLTDNFISVSLSVSSPDFVDAFDDAGWKVIVEHFRIAAWIAKEGGLKGIMFDPEGYGNTVICSRSQRRKEKSFTEYAAKVRQRGREVMAAMAREYPDMVFFTLFMNSGTALGALGGDPREAMLRNIPYALYPAFVNGWLDAVPPGLTIVDGFEMAYPHADEAQYLKQVNAIRNTTLGLVAPENRLKYRGQVQAGLALYLDAFIRMPKVDAHADVFTDPPLDGALVERLHEAACSALDAVDEYVWVYSEFYRWWPDAKNPELTRYWDEILPGTTEALLAAKDPFQRSLARAEKEFAVAERKARARGVPLRNLVKNGDFNNGAAGAAPPPTIGGGQQTAKDPVADWKMVQSKNSTGALDRGVTGYAGYGSALVEGAADGMFVQEVKVSPLAFYKVRAWLRQLGKGEASVRVGWRDAEGRAIGAPQPFLPKLSPNDQWRPVAATVKSPGGAATLVLQLAVMGQVSRNDKLWFDDAEVYAIDVN